MCTICAQNLVVGKITNLSQGPQESWSCCNICNANITEVVFPGNYIYLGLIEGGHKFQHVQDKSCPSCGNILHMMNVPHPNTLDKEPEC